MTYAIVVGRLAAQQGPRAAIPSSTKPLAPITIDYPAEGSVFPPEIPAPTFLWRDAGEDTTLWQINITFDGHVPAIKVRAPGEPMRVGEIDPRCVTETKRPTLIPQQAAMHTWTPDAGPWAAIKKHSEKHPATVTITGFRQEDPNRAVSRGQVNRRASKDPVGAPDLLPRCASDADRG